MNIALEIKKQREIYKSPSSSSENEFSRPRGYFFVARIMQSPDPKSFPVPAFYANVIAG